MAVYSVYNLGEKGVQLVKSPVHTEGGELERAQNCILDTSQREGSLRKRPGLVKVNSSALAGTVRGLVHVPFANPDDTAETTQTLYVAIDASTVVNTNTWRTTTNGSTYANATSPARAVETDKAEAASASGSFLAGVNRIASLDGKLYYPADNYTQYPTASHTAPAVRVFDGTTDDQAFQAPLLIAAGAATNTQFITDLYAANGYLYVACMTYVSGGSDNTYAAVFQFNPNTGMSRQVGPTLTLTPAAANEWFITSQLWFNGRLWISLASASTDGGTIRWIRPPDGGFDGDTSWTTAYTESTGEGIFTLAAFDGLLYAGVRDTGATAAAKVIVRSAAGTYSSSEADPNFNSGAGYSGTYYSMVVYEDELYVVLRSNGTATEHTVRKFDGSTWTEAYDILTNDDDAYTAGQGILFSDKLYYVVRNAGATTGNAVLENASGTWTIRDADSAALRCYAGVVEERD